MLRGLCKLGSREKEVYYCIGYLFFILKGSCNVGRRIHGTLQLFYNCLVWENKRSRVVKLAGFIWQSTVRVAFFYGIDSGLVWLLLSDYHSDKQYL